MKKLVLTLIAALLVVPAMADDQKAPQVQNGPAVVMDKDARHEAFQKARKEKKEQMKATKEKVEKLVKEYNKLKAGKKKDAKKAEIAAVVADIRAEQIKFNQEQLAQFEARLNQMREKLDTDKTPEAQNAWVAEKTDAVIAGEGDLKVLFDRDGKHEGMDGKGPHHKGRDVKPGKGFNVPRFNGPRPQPMPTPKDGQLPPPPAPEN